MQRYPSSPVAQSLPATVLGLLEHFEDNDDPGRPQVTTWIADTQAHFAALDFIDSEPWLVTGSLGVDTVSGVLCIHGLLVVAWKREAEVTGTTLRGVKVAQIRDAAAAEIRFFGAQPVVPFRDRVLNMFPESETGARSRLVTAVRTKRKRGRPALRDDDLRSFALAYLQDARERGTHGINKRLALEYQISERTAIDWVAKARRRGFLAPTKQGRANASAGENL